MPSFLDNLKQLIGGDISHNLNRAKIALVNVENGPRTIVEGNAIQLNVAELTTKERETLLPQIIKQAVQEENAILLSDESQTKIQEIEDFEQHPGIDPQLISFAHEKIPVRDRVIWKGALLVRHQHLQGNNQRATELRFDLIGRFGDRAKNITNLCTANYLEQIIRPLWEQLNKQGDSENQKFFDIYESIVTEQPFAVFVSLHETEEEIVREVLSKKELVIKYGWRKLAIHGIGEGNIRKVQAVAEKIRLETGVQPSISIQSEARHIKVLFQFA